MAVSKSRIFNASRIIHKTYIHYQDRVFREPFLLPRCPWTCRSISLPFWMQRYSTSRRYPFSSLHLSAQHMMIFGSSYSMKQAMPYEILRIRGAESAPAFLQSYVLRRSMSTPALKDIRSSDICTIPNAICMVRIAASPFIGYLVVDGRYEVALCCFICAGISDGLDGFIARNFNQKSVLGSYLDPMSDKILINVLATACAFTSLLPPWLVALILFRDVLLIGGSVMLARKVARESGKDFFMQAASFKLDSPLEIKATLISKANTVLQLTSISVALASAAYIHLDVLQLVAPWIHYATGATTVATLLDYMRRPGIGPPPGS